MKKLFALFALLLLVNAGIPRYGYAQDNAGAGTTEVPQDSSAQTQPADSVAGAENLADTQATTDAPAESQKEVLSKMQMVKKYFIEGDPIFMASVLICLILGLALCIERIIYLNLASTNTEKFMGRIDEALRNGGVSAAKEVCRNTRGPVAAIFFQGLERAEGEGDNIAVVEKSIQEYGSVQMSLLERGLSWISLFIAIAPMLGFMGTVFGMIVAFDKIAAANTINAAIVAGGIKVALLTTLAGLIVAIILQIFYNYILSKIDGIVIEMEESSIQFVDALYRRTLKK
jgi:biopolymer transport protein ExbB